MSPPHSEKDLILLQAQLVVLVSLLSFTHSQQSCAFQKHTKPDWVSVKSRQNLKPRKQGRAAAAAAADAWRPKEKQDGHIPWSSHVDWGPWSHQVMLRQAPIFTGHVSISNGCSRVRRLWGLVTAASYFICYKSSPDQRHSTDHRTFIIVGAKVTNKSLFWSRMVLFLSNLFLGTLGYPSWNMEYRVTFRRDTSDLGFIYCVWINFWWEWIQKETILNHWFIPGSTQTKTNLPHWVCLWGTRLGLSQVPGPNFQRHLNPKGPATNLNSLTTTHCLTEVPGGLNFIALWWGSQKFACSSVWMSYPINCWHPQFVFKIPSKEEKITDPCVSTDSWLLFPVENVYQELWHWLTSCDFRLGTSCLLWVSTYEALYLGCLGDKYSTVHFGQKKKQN